MAAGDLLGDYMRFHHVFSFRVMQHVSFRLSFDPLTITSTTRSFIVERYQYFQKTSTEIFGEAVRRKRTGTSNSPGLRS